MAVAVRAVLAQSDPDTAGARAARHRERQAGVGGVGCEVPAAPRRLANPPGAPQLHCLPLPFRVGDLGHRLDGTAQKRQAQGVAAAQLGLPRAQPNTQDLGGDCQPCGPSPERDSPAGEDPEQKLPRYVLQKGAGDSQVVARGELTAEMDLTVVCMAHGASHRGRGQKPGQADPPLLHLRREGPSKRPAQHHAPSIRACGPLPSLSGTS